MRTSVRSGPCGPCCSVEPVGTMIVWCFVRKASTSPFHLAPGLEMAVRSGRPGEPRRRAGRDQVAGPECHVAAQIRDDVGHPEAHAGGLAVLDREPVDRAAETEPIRSDLVGRYDPGTNR